MVLPAGVIARSLRSTHRCQTRHTGNGKHSTIRWAGRRRSICHNNDVELAENSLDLRGSGCGTAAPEVARSRPRDSLLWITHTTTATRPRTTEWVGRSSSPKSVVNATPAAATAAPRTYKRDEVAVAIRQSSNRHPICLKSCQHAIGSLWPRQEDWSPSRRVSLPRALAARISVLSRPSDDTTMAIGSDY